MATVAAVLLGIALFILGVSFWSCAKSRRWYLKLLANSEELSRLLQAADPNALQESAKIEPILGTYGKNISIMEESHFGALVTSRNWLFLATIVLIALEYYLTGIIGTAVAVGLFAAPATFDIVGPAKNYNMQQVADAHRP